MSKKYLFITDPWITLDHTHDTTLRLIQEGHLQGHSIYWCTSNDINYHSALSIEGQQLLGLQTPERRSSDFNFSAKALLDLTTFDEIHYRCDPPVDLHYQQPLYLLSTDPQVARKVINPISLLLTQSEKLLPTELVALGPQTLVSRNSEIIRETLFNAFQKQTALILKPLHLCQSIGVERLPLQTQEDLDQAFVKVFKLSENYQLPIVLQEFLPQILTEGETRLWFMHGQFIQAAQKIPKTGQAIINMDQGGTLQPYTLQPQDQPVIQALETYCQHHQIQLAAIDLIQGKITDLNYTSPGLLVAMEALYQQNLAQHYFKLSPSHL